MSRIQLIAASALSISCTATPFAGEVVSSSVVYFLKDAEHLNPSCIARGRVSATGTSEEHFFLPNGRDVAEERAITALSDSARLLGANAVVLDASAEVEMVPLDDNPEWGVHLEGDSFACADLSPAFDSSRLWACDNPRNSSPRGCPRAAASRPAMSIPLYDTREGSIIYFILDPGDGVPYKDLDPQPFGQGWWYVLIWSGERGYLNPEDGWGATGATLQ